MGRASLESTAILQSTDEGEADGSSEDEGDIYWETVGQNCKTPVTEMNVGDKYIMN